MTSRERLTRFLNEVEPKIKINMINAEFSNLEEVYHNNLKVWYYRNSDKKEQVEEEYRIVNLFSKDPDKLISSQMDNGIALTEEDFIEEEIKLLSILQFEELKRNEKKRLTSYINFLKDKVLPKQEPKVNLHSHIFVNNAFEVWQSMYESLDVKESDRSHVKFIFEEMKKKKLLHPTVDQIDFLKWIFDTYQIDVQKTSNYSRTRERLNAYSSAIQLYKKIN